MGLLDSILGGIGGQGAPSAPAAQPLSMEDRMMSPMGQAGLQLLANHGTLQSQQGAFSGVGEALTGAVKYKKAVEKQNKTLDYLRQNHPEIAGMVDSGLDVGEAFNYAMKERQFAADEARANKGPGPTSDMQNFQFGQKNPEFADYLSRNSTNGRLSTQPIYGTDAEGNTVLGQLSNDGRFVPSNLPDGVQPLSPYSTNEQKARGTAAGKNQADSQFSLPGARATADMVTQQVNDLKSDKALPRVLGPIDSRTPNFSSDAARVQSRINQIQGGAFLQARQLLKGGGAITDFEGKKAEDAFIRLNQAQSEKDFKDALDEFNYYVGQGVQKLEMQAGGRPLAPAMGSGLKDKYGLE